MTISPDTRRRVVGIAAHVGAALVLTFYFAQHATLAPNQSDGSLLMTYIEDFAGGKVPFRDVFDAYGLLNWPVPIVFYQLAGGAEWGIRVWMIVLKLGMVWLAFLVARRFGGVFYGALAAALLSVLVGQAWQSLQTPYAFLQVVPWVFGAWYLLLFRPLRSLEATLFVAGALTTGAIWTKLNAGLFLFAGGLFHCLYWLPASTAVAPRPVSAKRLAAFRIARVAGVVVFALVFYGFVRRYFNEWYFAYLGVPMLLGLGYTVHALVTERLEATPAAHHVRATLLYASAVLVLSAALLVAWCGWPGVLVYLGELRGLLSSIDYAQPFDRFGEPGLYRGLNERYWLQLPWLPTLAFGAWLWLARAGRGAAALGEAWAEGRSRTLGLFLFGTLACFTIYSRADETHVFQAMILVVPVLFAMLAQVEALAWGASRRRNAVRAGLVVAFAAWASSLVVRPSLAALRIDAGDWTSPKLKHLKFRPLDNPYVRNFSPDITDNEWDAVTDEAARYIDSITPDGAEVLILDPNRLLTFASNTAPYGGRYHYYFYLVSVGILDRKGFDANVPRHVVRHLFVDPPQVLISSLGRVAMLEEFPEFANLRDFAYVRTRNFRHILVYERRDRLKAPP